MNIEAENRPRYSSVDLVEKLPGDPFVGECILRHASDYLWSHFLMREDSSLLGVVEFLEALRETFA